MPGPLAGLTIIELAGLGPAPFAGMMLADNGATVIRVERPGVSTDPKDILGRSRSFVTLDLRSPEGVAELKTMVRTADALIEGFRPGVLERLGIGPDQLLAENQALVIGRMTGWGQEGPYAPMAGHDVNYIALTGALHTMRQDEGKPPIPLNLVGDFGGGGMLLAFGVLSALLHAKATGQGQVVDAAMIDGSSALMAFIMGYHARGTWIDAPGANTLNGGSHFYQTYETADGRFISVASGEPQFYKLLREKTGTSDDPEFDAQQDKSAWPRLSEKLAAIFREKTRDEWCAIMEGTDVCFAPVLTLSEAPDHPHHKARGTYTYEGGFVQPAPAPRYSVTKNDPPRPAGS